VAAACERPCDGPHVCSHLHTDCTEHTLTACQ
jgi:hypothetical protein